MSSSYKPTKTFIEQSNLRKAKIAGFIYDVNVRKFLFFCAQVNLFLNLLSYNKAGNDDETRANIYDILLILNNLVFLLDVSLQGFVNENFFLADDIYHLIDLGCSTMGFASASLIPYANSSYEKNNLLLVNAVTGFIRTWVANYIKEYTNPFKIVELNHRADIIVKNRKDLTLDLCYVKNNLIALSYPYPLDDPATEKKNTIDKVASYLNKYHENNYKVYNLCMEKQYNPIHFNNNVERFPIYDYEVPSLTDTLEFFKTLDKDFKSNKKHVKAFHCMAGKGRTGTLLSMYLLYDRTFFNYEDAMRFFAIKRSFGNKDTHFKGVETPSQRRFVKYFEEIMNKYQESLPRKRILNLKKIVLKSLSITNEMKIKIDSDNHKDFKEIELTDNKNFEVFEDKSEITVSNCRNLVNEVKMEFKSFSLDVDKNLKFSFIFHTAFVDEDTNKLVLGKSEIDNAERNFVPGDFGVELYFEQMIGV